MAIGVGGFEELSEFSRFGSGTRCQLVFDAVRARKEVSASFKLATHDACSLDA